MNPIQKIREIGAKKIVGYFFLFLLVFLGVLLVFTVKWLLKTWGLLTIDEIVYHLKASLDGTNPEMIKEYILNYGLMAFLVAVALFAGLFVIYRYAPRFMKKAVIAYILIGAVCISYAVIDFDTHLHVFAYVKQEIWGSDEDFIADNYVDPAEVDVSFNDEKRNLIYIYLESCEMTFADEENGGAFEQNVIPELTDLALENECFAGDSGILNGGVSMPGSTWTMGALFAQSSGLPLKIPLYSNYMKRMEDFFPTTVCLGDILDDEGYNQMFMCGSEAAFGGRDLYYSSHGNFNIYDLNTAIADGKIPEGYDVFWGFEDEKLFEYAEEQITALAAEDAPFNFTMLTVDTHFEDGYVCDLCEDEFGEQYANAFACSSRQVAAFVEWIQQQDFYDNTTIIISGDHPTMDSDFCDNVESSYLRKVYTTVINSAVEAEDPTAVREYTTMDMFPTTLAAMGATIEGNKLGLGTNLFSSEETLLEKLGVSTLTAKLNLSSEFINELSGISITQETMDRLNRRCYIRTAENEEGNIQMHLKKVWSTLSIDVVEKIEFRVTLTDPETGESEVRTYEATITQRENNPTKFDCIADTDISYADNMNITAQAYIWVDGFEEYLVCDYDPYNLDDH